MNAYVGYENIIPLVGSVDLAGSATAIPYMNIKYANRAAFLVILGNVNSATATDREVVTVEAATSDAGAAEAAIAFNYRLSGAVGTNTWGAITACASTGLSLDPATHDNMCLWIEVDPQMVHAAKPDANFVRLVFTPTPDMGAFLVGVVGIIDTIYKQTTHKSATASASS
jgi:hypothetical protein